MRLIDADAFSAFIKKAVAEQGYEVLRICDTLTVADVLNSVCAELDGTGLEGFLNAPTVDAVPVVRCKDCKHRPTGETRDDLEFPDDKCPCQCEDYWYSWKPLDNWFCGNGERKGGDNG